jgi:hypothetical protein
METECSRALATIDRVNESLYIYRSILVCKSDEAVRCMIDALAEKEYPCGESLESEGVRMLVQTFNCIKENIGNNKINLEQISIIYVMDLDSLSELLDLVGYKPERLVIIA